VATIDPISEAKIWLYQTLSADPTCAATFGDSIGDHPLDRDAGFPKLTYTCLTPQNDLLLVGTDIFWSGLRFFVRAIVEGNNTLAIKPALVALHDAIHGKYGYTDDAYIVSCTRIRPYYLHEMSDSLEYTHQGGEYLIRLRPRN